MYKQLSNLLLLATTIIFISSFLACTDTATNTTNTAAKTEANKIQNEKDFVATMQKHLDAVSNKDLAALKSTMSPTGKMQLILPATEIINTVDGFMNYHEEWFKAPGTWTFETKILNTEIKEDLGIAITEIIYSEPERNGEPYFNRMIVSYALEKVNGKWCIIKDHACSVEKSTDPK